VHCYMMYLKTWFKDWPDDDCELKHVATLIIDNKLVVLAVLYLACNVKHFGTAPN
jgi:hypothetical protein